MQSQLEAALLGQSSTPNLSSNAEDDETNEPEEIEEVEEEIDEEVEDDTGKNGSKPQANSSRTVTLQMLLDADILQPGKGTMTIEYLGQRFVGDLLEDGKIQSQETDIIFASPSAWAIACKRFINPDKKSGCGWASVKYRGRKLDAYKNIWYRKKKEEQDQENFEHDFAELKNMATTMSYSRVPVKHNTIANRTLTHDANTLIECVPFSSLGKIQPFLISMSTNAAFLMDFHCHLTKTEVSGYLAGQWDVNAHNLQITHAFPCRNTKADRDKAPQVEAEIQKEIGRLKLILVGWYHSHPFTQAAPTLRDIDAQLDYQIRMKGNSDNSYTPCVGIIISPYNYENTTLESSIIAYWVVPPPEAKPNEYGRPMLMSYNVSQDAFMSDRDKSEMSKCVQYYKKEKDFVNFNERFSGGSLYIDKLKATLMSKFPRDESETALWRYVRETAGCNAEECDSLLSIPSVSKSSMLPTLTTPVSLNSNLLLPSDISSLLYSGKFPSASSILGLPDPMAHSTLAANNMFLQSNLFKMQELLKPLSTSSPISSLKKEKPLSSPLKIPSDIKSLIKQPDFNTELLNLKNKMAAGDFSIPSISSDYNKSGNKSDFDFYATSSNASYDLSASMDLSKNISDLSETLAKMPKNDYSLNLSNKSEAPSDFSLNLTQNSEKSADGPLNLAN